MYSSMFVNIKVFVYNDYIQFTQSPKQHRIKVIGNQVGLSRGDDWWTYTRGSEI